MRDDKARLTDILEAIERIENYSIRGEEVFRSNELIQTWMVRHNQVIGEAARSISEDLRNRSPEIPWSDIIGVCATLSSITTLRRTSTSYGEWWLPIFQY